MRGLETRLAYGPPTRPPLPLKSAALALAWPLCETGCLHRLLGSVADRRRLGACLLRWGGRGGVGAVWMSELRLHQRVRRQGQQGESAPNAHFLLIKALWLPHLLGGGQTA